MSEQVTFHQSHLDYNNGQHYLTAWAQSGEKIIGYVDFSIYENKIYIDMVKVEKEFQRQKIATKLFNFIRLKNENLPIVPGFATEEGNKFFKSYKKHLKLAEKILAEAKKKAIIAYHASDAEFNTFDLKKDRGFNLFGQAIYFSTSDWNTSKFGRYVKKYALSLENTLNLNQSVSNEYANKLLLRFNQFAKTKLEYDFNDDFDGVEFGEFFEQIQEISEDINKVYKLIGPFIQSLGYDSFCHYADDYTNYVSSKTSVKTYGVYDVTKIKYLDGPF